MKKFQNALKKVDLKKSYSISDAAKLLKEISFTKFDGTIELCISLNVDSKQADQQIRGAVVLPHGIGKTRKVLAITSQEAQAKEAGADFVGGKDMLEKIKSENWFGFDVIVATPDMMPELGKFGKLLGPKGLMPNIKDGTISPDIKKVVTEIKKGKLSYRVDKDGNLNTVIGKVSFSEHNLVENFEFFMDNLVKTRPSTVKGKFIQNISLSCTMGPGVKINWNKSI